MLRIKQVPFLSLSKNYVLKSRIFFKMSTTMLEKLELAAPYNIFYNSIPDISSTLNEKNSITFEDFLCPSLGELKSVLHVTAKLDIKWLIKQYENKNLGSLPISVLYFEYIPEIEEHIKDHLFNVNQHCITRSLGDNIFVNFHSKIWIFSYTDKSLRLVVSTANLTEIQFRHFNHGFWVSPLCHPLPSKASETDGESPTNFKLSLLNYFREYNLPILNSWIELIKRTDFSDVRVFLTTSVAGKHASDDPKSLMQQIENLLKRHCELPKGEEDTWSVIAQASCLGKFGSSPSNWLKGKFLKCLGTHIGSNIESTPLKIIFPSKLQVERARYNDSVLRNGLRYLQSVHEGQIWIIHYLYKWKSDSLNRTRVMPHTKTYCRISECCSKMAWFLLTSANITGGAWGRDDFREEGRIYVKNYEIGVMFFPKFFDEEYFNVGDSGEEKVFPLIYDLPLEKYQSRDQPWTSRITQKFRQKFERRVQN